MERQISSLNPEMLWKYFLEICKIPRPSKRESKIARYITGFGKQHHLETLVDGTGNILIRKPGTKGNEKSKAVILQCHMDMVCEKNAGNDHDFDNDPIQPYIDGDWIKAKGTTLGADDGIGIASCLAVLSSTGIAHGPLECLFTVDEETGLTGAFGLKPDFLKGQILLNLDSEDEGELFIGCAGGRDTVATFKLETEDVPDNSVAWKIGITGLKGGHSGDDINKGLANAVKLLNRFLWNAASGFQARIASFDAGNLRNAIAREGFAVITMPEPNEPGFMEFIKSYDKTIHEEFRASEPELRFSAVKCDLPGKVIVPELEYQLLNALYACPHGVLEYSRDIPNFVETSTNLASVKFNEDTVVVTTSQRSSVESAKKDACDMVESLFNIAGATVEHSVGYPGWKPDPSSRVLGLTVDSYQHLFNTKPKVLVIHAGLECGLIGAIYPGMDMVSFGPTIKGAHSPDERLDIKSTEKFWELLVDLLVKIAKDQPQSLT